MNLKHSIHVTNDALPSWIMVSTQVISNTYDENGAARDASSDKAIPTSAFLKAHVSLVPSPQKLTILLTLVFNKLTKSPLFAGFILAYTLVSSSI